MEKPKSPKQALYDFVINNSDLEILESHLNQFNPFSILRIENFEIRHSNVLAWLLNPDGNHKLDDYFLKKVDYSGQTVPPIPGQSVPPFLG